jgi:plastocyanin
VFAKVPEGLMRLISLLFIAIFFLTACGSSSNDVLFIETHTSIIKVSERIALTAQATELLGSPIEWEVQELDGGSLMRSTGQQVTYIAPSYAGTYRVIAKATRANGERARAVQVIIVQPQLVIEPASVKLAPGETCAFKVIAKGVDSPKIQWSIDEPDGGTITSNGEYKAPSKPGFYTVAATALTDGRPSVMATVRVE